MRIAFIGTRGVPATYSGFETCVEQVGSRMVKRGHEVTVFCRSGHYREKPASYRGINLHYLPALRRKHLETLSHTALSALSLPRDTAIVCMGVGNAPVVRALEAFGRSCVFNVDGADWQRQKWGGMASRYLRACESLAAGGRSALVADARAVELYYRERFKRGTELIAYGADPPADIGTDTLEHFGLTPGSYVLWVGRLVPENGAHDLIAAGSHVKLPVPIAFVGDATYSERYKASLRAAAPLGTIFTGFQFGSAYQQLSAHAGIYVLAASVGGTHPVLLEQMAAGNCILARDTSSNREVLGDTGRFWRTPGELADVLRNVWANASLRRRLGDAARARAERAYDWETVTRHYLDLCAAALTGT